MAETPRVLICFDGSPGAEHAIAVAARLFPRAQARVAHAWQPPLPVAAMKGGIAFQVAREVEDDLLRQAEEHAGEIAGRGTELARSGGLDAQPLVVRAAGAVWSALLDAARDESADVIVAGSRGWGEVRALLLGSTSSGVTHHATLPVLVVPAEGGE